MAQEFRQGLNITLFDHAPHASTFAAAVKEVERVVHLPSLLCCARWSGVGQDAEPQVSSNGCYGR